MAKYKVKISSKGQIAIPKKIRDKISSDVLEMEILKDNEIRLRPTKSISYIGGALKKYAHKGRVPKNQEAEVAWEAHVKEEFGRT